MAGGAPAPWSGGALAELGARLDGTILALGPLTNLAGALAAAPSRPAGRVVAMGGSLRGTGEFNFGHDPAAARRVTGSGLAVTIVPIELTGEVRFDRRAVAAIGRDAANPLVGPLLAASLARRGGREARVHDAVALLALSDPELMATARGRVALTDAGHLTVEPDPGGPCQVAVALDAPAAARRLTELWLASPA